MKIDMRKTIVIKTDQLNADDLIAGPRTIKIRDVVAKETGEQRAHLFFDGDNGKPYKPNTSMLKILCAIWGPDGAKWVGRSMTVFNDKTVKWAGQPVGGIRISHMSHIDEVQVNTIAVTRGQKKPYTVKPLENQPQTQPKEESAPVELTQEQKTLIFDGETEALSGLEAYQTWFTERSQEEKMFLVNNGHHATLKERASS